MVATLEFKPATATVGDTYHVRTAPWIVKEACESYAKDGHDNSWLAGELALFLLQNIRTHADQRDGIEFEGWDAARLVDSITVTHVDSYNDIFFEFWFTMDGTPMTGTLYPSLGYTVNV